MSKFCRLLKVTCWRISGLRFHATCSHSVADSVGEYHCTLKARNDALTLASEECGRKGDQ
jgi:hypothetical protein